MSWLWTPSDRIGERLMGYCAAIKLIQGGMGAPFAPYSDYGVSKVV